MKLQGKAQLVHHWRREGSSGDAGGSFQPCAAEGEVQVRHTTQYPLGLSNHKAIKVGFACPAGLCPALNTCPSFPEQPPSPSPLGTEVFPHAGGTKSYLPSEASLRRDAVCPLFPLFCISAFSRSAPACAKGTPHLFPHQ